MSYPKAQTKVIATLGPATDGREREIIAAGASALRINCSHGQAADWKRRVTAARKEAKKAGRPVAILVDLCGPKIRLAAKTPSRQITAGDKVNFSTKPGRGRIVVDWPKFPDAIKVGRSEIVIGDGAPRFLVEDVVGEVIIAKATSGGAIEPRRGIAITHASHQAPALTRKDLDDLEFAAAIDADFVALSFVRSRADVELLQMALRLRDCSARTIAKIEKIEAIDNIEDIVAAADGIMVARGDLGVEAGVSRVPLLQKEILDAGRAAGKLTVIATQMLESMIDSPEPTRAEAGDIANAVFDGASSVMLSAETATGKHPVEAIEAMVAIASMAESGPMRAWEVGSEDAEAAAVMQSAVLLARNISAEAIIAVTGSGGSARAAAKYRPRRPLVALTADERVARQLALEWGVIPATIERKEESSQFQQQAIERAQQLAGFPSGRIVLTHGPAGDRAGTTNVVMIAHTDHERN